MLCRFEAGGRCSMICRMFFRKPMSRSRSASSRINTCTFRKRDAKPGVFARWSCKRPGVAMRILQLPKAGLFWSREIFFPPNTHAEVRPRWNFTSVAASFSICEASSRTGLIMRAWMAAVSSSPADSLMRSTVGTRKPRVLPVPVLALATTSMPFNRGTTVRACTSVMDTKPNPSAMARWLSADNGSWSNLSTRTSACSLPFCTSSCGTWALRRLICSRSCGEKKHVRWAAGPAWALSRWSRVLPRP
mmetsp:Transcript_102838/g.331801  ORF Transcript_102838/g.331801 Transcript_102838/m.331801 type:complete len:247 (-) Transcript_102838:191-931(-)